MTICIATPEYYLKAGGIATFYRNLAAVFSDAGHRIIVLTVNDQDFTGSDAIKKEANLTIITLKETYRTFYKKYTKNASKASFAVASTLAIGNSMRKWLLKNQAVYGFDVIESVELDGIGGFLINPKLPAVVVCGHGALFQMARHDFVMRDKRYTITTSLEKKAILLADLVITHSLLNKTSLEKECTIPVILTTPPWKKEESNAKQDNIENDFLVVGRLQTCKGIGIIAEALLQSKKQGKEINITWVGRDTYTAPYGSTWSKYLKKRYPSIWQKNLKWLPEISREEIKKIIASAGIVIVPSLWESFNYVAIEAIAAGRHLIISEGAGASYMLRDYEGVTVIPANDPQAILISIEKLSHPLHKKNPSETGTNFIHRVFSDEKVLSDRLKCYAIAIQNRAKRENFKVDDEFSENRTFNLRLSPIFYLRIFLLRILARI